MSSKASPTQPVPLIDVQQIGKAYPLSEISHHGSHTAQAKLFRMMRSLGRLLGGSSSQRMSSDSFWALKDVSFKVFPGQMVSLLGHNGAGKSTLLKLLCRVSGPSEGTILLKGRINNVLSSSAGMALDLTGRENIEFFSTLLGSKSAHIKTHLEEIADFAQIGSFIDTPVRFYSTGMRSRLGFSIMLHHPFDCLLIDEGLGTLDKGYQQVVLDKIAELKTQGKALMLVSHGSEEFKALCDRGLLLNQGQLILDGSFDDAFDAYQQLCYQRAHHE